MMMSCLRPSWARELLNVLLSLIPNTAFFLYLLRTKKTRLDINAPNFEAYQKTLPGLFKKKASS